MTIVVRCDVPGATVRVQATASEWIAGTTDESGSVSLVMPGGPRDSHLTIDAAGYRPYQQHLDAAPDLVVDVRLVPLVLPLPPPPTRDEILSARGSFQGLMVETKQYGRLPWFDPFLGSLSLREDRQAVYTAKHAAGQHRLTLALSYAYRADRGRNAYAEIPGRDFSKDLPALHALMEEAIREGFIIDLRMAGDGQSSPDGGYNDPVGDTYGHAWLMAHAAEIHAALADLDPWTIYGPGFDGVFSKQYEWLPEQVRAWWRLMRSLVGPSGYVSIEWGAGICDLGDAAETYRGDGEAVDVIYLEFPYPMAHTGQPKPDGIGYVGDEIWQVAARILGPAYVAPPDAPRHAIGDPAAPYDPGPHVSRLAGGTPRGPFYAQADEHSTYGWVRGCSREEVEQNRAYLRSVGFELVG